MSSLEGVKVGDCLFWQINPSDKGQVECVNRITNACAYTKNERWRIHDGRKYGMNKWDYPTFARIATPADLHQVKARKSREYARAKFGHMTNDQAIRVADFIREMLKESAE